MSDFESRVRTLLVENVDQVAGARRAAPPFDPSSAPGRTPLGPTSLGPTPRRSTRKRWAAPLLAAACVALVGGAAAVVVGTHTTPAPPHPQRPRVVGTDRVVIRPVTPAGTPAAGYRVESDPTGNGFTCTSSSPVAVDRGVAACGFFGATALPACYRSTAAAYVLCLPQAQSRVLYRIRLSGRFPSTVPATAPTPLQIVLTDGDRCTIPATGSTPPQQHPDWELKYTCRSGGSVFAPHAGDGVDRASSRWTVLVFRSLSDHGTVHAVRSANFVGTA